MFHRNNVHMILNHHNKNECINIQHSYNDIVYVIVVLCSINYLNFFSKGQNPRQPFCKRQYVKAEIDNEVRLFGGCRGGVFCVSKVVCHYQHLYNRKMLLSSLMK